MNNRRWLWLLTLPTFGLAFPPIYSRATPEVFGIPFFYLYQFAWIPVTAFIVGIVHRKTR